MTRRDWQAALSALALVASLLLAAMLAGCTPYAPARAAVDSLRLALGGYQTWTHTERRRLLTEAQPRCGALAETEARACYEATLLLFEARQKPVLACTVAAAPAVRAVELAVAAKDAAAAQAALPELAARSAACAVAIQEARQ